jgi:hypothetical protein
MSETATATRPKPLATRDSSTDQRVFAEIEKWMATIRELSREPAKT